MHGWEGGPAGPLADKDKAKAKASITSTCGTALHIVHVERTFCTTTNDPQQPSISILFLASLNTLSPSSGFFLLAYPNIYSLHHFADRRTFEQASYR